MIMMLRLEDWTWEMDEESSWIWRLPLRRAFTLCESMMIDNHNDDDCDSSPLRFYTPWIRIILMIVILSWSSSVIWKSFAKCHRFLHWDYVDNHNHHDSDADHNHDVDDLIHEGDVNLQVWERIYSGVFSGWARGAGTCQSCPRAENNWYSWWKWGDRHDGCKEWRHHTRSRWTFYFYLKASIRWETPPRGLRLARNFSSSSRHEYLDYFTFDFSQWLWRQ